MFDSLLELGKCGLCLLLVFLILVCVRHYKAVKRVQYYTDQGMSPVPGYDKFLLGNASDIMQYRKLREANKGKLLIYYSG